MRSAQDARADASEKERAGLTDESRRRPVPFRPPTSLFPSQHPRRRHQVIQYQSRVRGSFEVQIDEEEERRCCG